jgi:hypothetical protein
MRTWMVTIGVAVADDCDENRVQEIVSKALSQAGLQHDPVIVLGNLDEVQRLNAEAEARRQAGER